jgi:ATP-dependent Zn protease
MTIGKPYSEDTASQIDEEVMKIIKKCYDRTKTLLESKMKEIDELAKLLIEKEVVGREEVELILGKRPYDSHVHAWAEKLEKD